MSSIVITFIDNSVLNLKNCEVKYIGAFAIVKCADGDQEIYPSHEIKRIKVLT